MVSDLHPDHKSDLEKSGLTEETIRASGVYSVRPADISKKLEGHFPKVESLLSFPYPGADGYERVKLFPPQVTDKGTVKYYQKAGSPCRLYFPPGVEAILQDASCPLYFTEGEKKALKAVQEGIPCIGEGGLWNWSDGSPDKNLIPDFERINLKGRTVYLIPDNDWLNPDRHGDPKNLREAVYELAYRLIDQGAKVYIVELPPGPEKVGLDDYLCHHSVDEFEALPRRERRKQTIDELIREGKAENIREILTRISKVKSMTERDIFIEQVSKQFRISKRAIRKDLKIDDEGKEENQKPGTLAYFPGLVDLCTYEGGIAFLVKGENGPETSGVYEIEGKPYTPPGREYLPFLLPRGEEVSKLFHKEDGQLFDAVQGYLKRFSFLPEPQWMIVTLFAFLTYIQDHPDIHYFPMLLFWAAPERGKSRTGKALVHVCYRGIHLVDLREANLFRYAENLRATLFFDVMDLWKKAERNQSEDILLLRYEKGAQVARVLYPEKGAFKDMVHYSVYGPTIMASNEPVHHILDTRCLAISMPNKPGDYENLNLERAEEIRDRLTAWRARVLDKPLPEAESMPGLNGRLWDISRPLLQVCKLACPDKLDFLKAALLDIANQRLESKQETLDGQIVSILKDLSPEGIPEWEIQIQDIVDKLNEKRPEGHKLTPRYVGQRIKGLSIPKRKTHGVFEAQLTTALLATLLFQYGFGNSLEDIPQNTSPTSPTSPNSINSETYAGGHSGDIGGHCPERPPERPPKQDELFPQVKDIGDIGDVRRGTMEDKKNDQPIRVRGELF